jgi:hypothetical protein
MPPRRLPPPGETFRRVPWDRVRATAVMLFTEGRHRLETNLSDRERRELFELLRHSRGRARNLSTREQARTRELVRRGLTGKS